MSRRLYMSVSEDAIGKAQRAYGALEAVSDLCGNIADKARTGELVETATLNAGNLADLLDCIKLQLKPCVKSAVLA